MSMYDDTALYRCPSISRAPARVPSTSTTRVDTGCSRSEMSMSSIRVPDQ